MILSTLRNRYDEYVDTFRDASGKLPEMMQLKYAHTMMVMENSRVIAEGEHFTAEEKELALMAALLHDTGRYEQLRRYNTFQDTKSIDHAVFSHQIVTEQGWIDSKPVMDAVLYHNRRELPEGLDPLTFRLSHTVRDADKLDIFRVLEDRVRHSDWRTDSRAFWNLQPGEPPSEEVVSAIRAHRPVDYQQIRTLADFVLIQIGWMISGLHFATSRTLCAERGHLRFRREFLSQIGGGDVAMELCDLAECALYPLARSSEI